MWDRGENSPNPSSRFEPLQPQDTQVVDFQRGDLEVHGESRLFIRNDLLTGHEPAAGRARQSPARREQMFTVGPQVFLEHQGLAMEKLEKWGV